MSNNLISTSQELNFKASKAVIEEYENQSKSYFGFWVYLMTDCVLFASLFAVFAVLRNNDAGGPSSMQLFSLPYALVETLVLLTSSFSCGLAVLSAQNRHKKHVVFWLSLTALLGLTFLGLEINEFSKFIAMGDSWRRSGFLSGYFVLVSTHGLHITIGLIWLIIMIYFFVKKGLTIMTIKRLRLFSLFWHFLDVVWIFIFTIVYLMGAFKL